MKLFYLIRVHWKLFKRDYIAKGNIKSFCKECGRDVHDFKVDDIIWNAIDQHIKNGHTLCYDCFCEYCYKIGVGGGVWELKEVR